MQVASNGKRCMRMMPTRGSRIISRGMTFDGQQELASSFEVGVEYEFEIGWYSRVIMRVVLHEIQAVQGYRLVE
jgi:hypothetical protein